MKKITGLLTLLLLALTMASCNGAKTVNDREEARQMAEDFYKDLTNADPVTMSSYSNGELTTVFAKDHDIIHIYSEDGSFDVYSFVKDGKRYTISDDGNLYEDDTTYDFYADSIETMLKMNVTGYFDVEDDTLSFSASKKGDDQLDLLVKEKQDDRDLAISSKGTKENGKVSSIVCEIKDGENTYQSEYRFTYDEHIEVPEYTIPKTYEDLPHVKSPYSTYREIIDDLDEDESLTYIFNENNLFVIGEKDDRHYQFSSAVGQDLIDQIDSLDFFADDYQDRVYDLIGNLEIEDCIDFTDELISEQQLEGYIGKQIGDLLSDGFEVKGYSFFEDDNIVLADKDQMTYEFDVILPENFDPEGEFEFDAFNSFVIEDASFSDVEYSVLPMR